MTIDSCDFPSSAELELERFGDSSNVNQWFGDSSSSRIVNQLVHAFSPKLVPHHIRTAKLVICTKCLSLGHP